MFCYKCGAPVGDNDRFCGVCGAMQAVAEPVPEVKTKPATCAVCGTVVGENDKFCGGCGAVLGQTAPVQTSLAEETVVIPVVEEPQQKVTEIPVAEEVPAEEPAADQTQVFAAVQEETPMEFAEPAAEQEPVCPACGAPILPDEVFCGACGARLQEVPAEAAQAEVTPVDISEPIPQEKPAACKQKNKLLIILLILIPLLIAGAVATYIIVTENNNAAAYSEAVALLEDRQYDAALEAFTNLGSYQDSADKVQELTTLQERYEEAYTLITKEHNFEEAKKIYTSLGDYRDSQEMAEKGIQYHIARFLMNHEPEEEALAQAYVDSTYLLDNERASLLTALDILTNLNGYEDSDKQISACYKSLCQLELEEGEYDMALYYADKVGEAYYEEVYEQYLNNCADRQFLNTLMEVYNTWDCGYGCGSNYNHESIQELKDMLDYLYYLRFSDAVLLGTFYQFMDLLDEQWNNIDSNGEIVLASVYYGTVSQQFEIFRFLYEDYGFMNEEESWDYLDYNVGYYYAQENLENLVWDQLVGVAADYDSATDTYYLTFRNDNICSFTLWIDLEFYLGNNFVSETDWYCVEIGRGKTVRVPIYFEEDSDWDSWYIYWDFADIDDITV